MIKYVPKEKSRLFGRGHNYGELLLNHRVADENFRRSASAQSVAHPQVTEAEFREKMAGAVDVVAKDGRVLLHFRLASLWRGLGVDKVREILPDGFAMGHSPATGLIWIAGHRDGLAAAAAMVRSMCVSVTGNLRVTFGRDIHVLKPMSEWHTAG